MTHDIFLIHPIIANGPNDSNDRPIMTSSRMQSEMIQRLASRVQTTENYQYLYGL